MRKWDINKVIPFECPTTNYATSNSDSTEQCAFPATDIIKIGRVIYRVHAHYNDKHDALKPKIEKLLRREMAHSRNTPEFANALCEFLCYNIFRKHCLSAAGKESI